MNNYVNTTAFIAIFAGFAMISCRNTEHDEPAPEPEVIERIGQDKPQAGRRDSLVTDPDSIRELNRPHKILNKGR
jgi:hypothetical protein